MVVRDLECMAITVINIAPQTVRTISVTYIMGHAMLVNLDGWERHVIQNVEMECTVSTVVTNVQAIVEIGLFVVM